MHVARMRISSCSNSCSSRTLGAHHARSRPVLITSNMMMSSLLFCVFSLAGFLS